MLHRKFPNNQEILYYIREIYMNMQNNSKFPGMIPNCLNNLDIFETKQIILLP